MRADGEVTAGRTAPGWGPITGQRRVNSRAEGLNLHSCLRPDLKLVLLAFDFSGLLKDREDESDACRHFLVFLLSTSRDGSDVFT